MKKVADATNPPVVIPVVIIAIAVHLALVIPPVEGDVTIYKMPSVPLLFEVYSMISELYRIPYLKYVSILYQVASFFESSRHHAICNLNRRYSRRKDTGLGRGKP